MFLGAPKGKLIHFMQNFVFIKGCNKQAENFKRILYALNDVTHIYYSI